MVSLVMCWKVERSTLIHKSIRFGSLILEFLYSPLSQLEADLMQMAATTEPKVSQQFGYPVNFLCLAVLVKDPEVEGLDPPSTTMPQVITLHSPIIATLLFIACVHHLEHLVKHALANPLTQMFWVYVHLKLKSKSIHGAGVAVVCESVSVLGMTKYKLQDTASCFTVDSTLHPRAGVWAVRKRVREVYIPSI